jgi:hypothetical protein
MECKRCRHMRWSSQQTAMPNAPASSCGTRPPTNSAVELFLDGSSTRLTIPSGKIFAFTINISGVKSDGSAVAHYLRQYCLKNVAGTTTEVYAPVTIGTDNAAGTSIAFQPTTPTTPSKSKSPASSTRHGAGSPASMQSKSPTAANPQPTT